MGKYQAHYDQLFGPLEAEHGKLDVGHARRVRLREYSRASIDGREYGIHEVLAATDH